MSVIDVCIGPQGSPRMAIRRSIKTDAAALLDIWVRAVRATHTFLTESEIQSLLPVVRDRVLPALDLWILCDDASSPIGFMGVGERSIEALFIAPEWFRSGGGTLLVDFARSRLRRPIEVDVNEQNPEAVKFYEAMGFERVGRSPLDGDGRPYPLLHLRERN